MAENRKIAEGVVHRVPADVRDILLHNEAVLIHWEDLTPLARNEWLCWIEDAKKADTRQSRIDRLCSMLPEGKRRPCCWPGCSHRTKNKKSD